MEPEMLRQSIHQQKRGENTPDVAREKKHQNPQMIYSWKAPLRAYKRKPAGVLRFYIALASLLTFIAIFLGEIILAFPIWATVFLVYVLTITPPPKVENKITKFGIETAGKTFRWDSLSHFYFVKRYDYDVLVIVSAPPDFTHVYLVIYGSEVKRKVLHHLSEHIIYQEEPQYTFTDKLATWLTTLMPDHEEKEEPKPEGIIPQEGFRAVSSGSAERPL